MSVSVVIVARDEALNIEECIASAAWAEETLVVDTGSCDATTDLARAAGARVVAREWLGYGPTKNWAFEQVEGDWILSLDADERVGEKLAGEIAAVAAADVAHAAYEMPRKFYFMGRWLRHGGCYPDRQLRLFRRGRARYGEDLVHESLGVDGSVGRLQGHLEHFSYPTLSQFLQKLDEYSTLWAREAFRRGRRFRWYHALSAATGFGGRYLLKAGFLDGLPGACWAVLAGFHSYMKYAKLAELERAGGR